MRVIAGQLRGRRLLVDPGCATRPTSERARAGLFDWLGERVRDAQVLDLFAGSGSLGIEALSRGARCAVFVEQARGALRALRQNLDALELRDPAVIAPRDVRRFLAGEAEAHAPFDLVLADPPYGADWPAQLAGCARLAGLLAAYGVLVIERSARDPQPRPAAGLALRGSKVYGETVFDWFDREEGVR
jgi:16S rRNA (guanine966-N2)-methyltransferase